ncbi:MAG: aromatic ring-hydroxylating dioxygenase subunit alpha [Candidatus Sericytochromatia bacterium]|nr:aromatic ring-hydroxylating dioxygenase subunit alpha [Candidatus Sericytochromatia bacterium]
MDLKKLEEYWFILCESKDVKKKPKSFKILNKQIVVYRTENKEAVAFIDKCPHRNIQISEGQVCNGRLVCPFHGWEFDKDGKCVKVPGMIQKEELRAPKLKKYQIIEQEGYIWICLKPNPDSPRKPHIPTHISDKSMKTGCYRTHLKCGIVDIAENFLDPFHTPFVHAGIIRTSEKRYINKINPIHIKDGLEVNYLKEKPQSGFISLFGPDVLRDLGRFLMPGIIELEYFSKDHLEFVNTMYITPRSETESSIYFKASLKPYLIPVPLVFVIAGFAIKFALNQDKVILEKQTNIITEQGESYTHTELDIVRKQLNNLYENNGKLVEFKNLEALI